MQCSTMLILNIAETGVATLWFNDATVSGSCDTGDSPFDIPIFSFRWLGR